MDVHHSPSVETKEVEAEVSREAFVVMLAVAEGLVRSREGRRELLK